MFGKLYRHVERARYGGVVLTRLIFLITIFSNLSFAQIRTIAAVKALSEEEIALAPEVELEVQVTKAGLSRNGLFVHDGIEGIYVSFVRLRSSKRNYEQGEMLKVTGVVNEGRVYAHINAEKVEVLGKKELPAPRTLTRDSLYDAEMDCQWVKVRGIFISTNTTGEVQSFQIRTLGDVLHVIMPRTDESEEWAKKQINRLVDVRGALGTRFNSRRQMTGRLLQVHSPTDVTPIENAQGNFVEMRSIENLLRAMMLSIDDAKVRGVVSHTGANKFYIQDDTGSLLVWVNGKPEVEVGDFVENSGTIVLEDHHGEFFAHRVKKLKSAATVEPLMIDPEVSIEEKWHHSLCQLEATLIQTRESSEGTVLSCSVGDFVFQAIMAPGVRLQLQPNSILKLTGICQLVESNWQDHVYLADGIVLELRERDGVEIVALASWWTVERVVYILGVLLAGFLLVGVWAWLLRMKVAKQTSIIGAQMEREVVTMERQRLARELHDSFEQNISGLALQLETAQRKLEKGEDITPSFALAKKLINHSIRESRESIHDLRRSDEGPDFMRWYDDFLLAEAEQTGTKIEVELKTTKNVLTRVEQRQVFQIIREASLNAIRHGKAQNVMVSLARRKDKVCLVINDDGGGFDPEAPRPPGHFGLIGMKERAQRLRGTLNVQSEVGKGTMIEVEIPCQAM